MTPIAVIAGDVIVGEFMALTLDAPLGTVLPALVQRLAGGAMADKGARA